MHSGHTPSSEMLPSPPAASGGGASPSPSTTASPSTATPPLDWRKESHARRQIEAEAAAQHATEASLARRWAALDSAPWDGRGLSRQSWMDGESGAGGYWREPLLHSAARVLNAESIRFFLSKGASPLALNSGEASVFDVLFSRLPGLALRPAVSSLGEEADKKRLDQNRLDCIALIFSALPAEKQVKIVHRLVDDAIVDLRLDAAALFLEIAPNFELDDLPEQPWAFRAASIQIGLDDPRRASVVADQVRFFEALAARFGSEAINRAQNKTGSAALAEAAATLNFQAFRSLALQGADFEARDAQGRGWVDRLDAARAKARMYSACASVILQGQGEEMEREANAINRFAAEHEGRQIREAMAASEASAGVSPGPLPRPALKKAASRL